MSFTSVWAPKPIARPAIPALAISGAISNPNSLTIIKADTTKIAVVATVRIKLLRVRSLLPDEIPEVRELTNALEKSWVSIQAIIAATKITKARENVYPNISMPTMITHNPVDKKTYDKPTEILKFTAEKAKIGG